MLKIMTVIFPSMMGTLKIAAAKARVLPFTLISSIVFLVKHINSPVSFQKTKSPILREPGPFIRWLSKEMIQASSEKYLIVRTIWEV
jgi:hypothetical protein